MKYAYTAVFEQEDGGYVVSFPDLPGCITEGDSIEDAAYMAKDALCLWLYDKEQTADSALPVPSDPATIKMPSKGFISVVVVDTEDYQKFYNTKAVKKTLTIPAWLNDKAEAAHAPYSQILQRGLKDFLGIN